MKDTFGSNYQNKCFTETSAHGGKHPKARTWLKTCLLYTSPSSAFRDLSKDVGAQIGSQTIQMNSQSEGVEQLALGALQDAYRSTTQALSKNIKKNKAKLKYNTQVFLVNNKDKEQ